MDREELKKIIETLLFITDHPLSPEKLCRLSGEKDAEAVSQALAAVKGDYAARNAGIQLNEVAGGFQLATRPEYGRVVRKLFHEKMTMRLSSAALETLAIVAYRQPLTRAEIESLRGVEVIAPLETLLERRLLKVVGRKETVGRPLLYGTTVEFLKQFGFNSLEDMPPLETVLPPESLGTALQETMTGQNANGQAAETSVAAESDPAQDAAASREQSAAVPEVETQEIHGGKSGAAPEEGTY
ncbi:MAG: SMC-Scp complex subunit ScpB [bacterium]